MKIGIIGLLFYSVLFTAFDFSAQRESAQLRIVRNMIEAVNQQNESQYVAGFSDTIKVYVDQVLKVDGKEALEANRARHFERYPETRSKIQHLVEIDEKVVMHDEVWLYDQQREGQDIVKIFTFQAGMVVRMDVIQSKTLFEKKGER